MLKKYIYNGKEYQFEESKAPAGAVLVDQKPAEKKADTKNKAAAPANKAVKAK